MNNRINQHVGAVLTAIDEATPKPPPLPTSPSKQSVQGHPLLVATGAFAAVLVAIGLVALVMRPGVDEIQDAATTPSPPASSTTLVSEGVPAQPLPRFTIGLPDWNIVDVVDSDQAATAILSKAGANDEQHGATISVWRDSPGDRPGTGYETALASHAEAEHLGTAEIDGWTAEVFHYYGEDPEYQFLWQNTDSITVQVVIFRADYADAEQIVAAIVPITQESWAELVDEFAPAEMATTTMPPDTPGIYHSEPLNATTTTMP